METRSRRIVQASLLALALSNFGLGRGQEPKPSPFVPGEKLTYEITWSIFHAGEATATLRKEDEAAGDAYEVETTAHSAGFVSLLYRVQNEFHSLFDPQTLCSRQISKKVNEGRRHKETRIVFDAARRLAILDERDLAVPNAPPKHAENEIPACVQDVVSAFYYLRRQPLRLGQQFVIPVNDGSKTHKVTVEVQARERIQTPLGPRDAFRTEPRVFGDLYKRKGRMLVWFSDDEQRLPLRVKAMISVGSITGNLKSVSTNAGAAPSAANP